MAVANGGTGQSFADLVAAVPQPIPEMVLAHRPPKMVDEEVYFLFSSEELAQSAEDFRFSIVLKFLMQHPSLNVVRAFIHSRF